MPELTKSQSQWSRVCVEKLMVGQLVKKFPSFCGTPVVIMVMGCTTWLSSVSHQLLTARAVCVGVVDKMALGWVFLRVLWFYLVTSAPPMLYTHPSITSAL